MRQFAKLILLLLHQKNVNLQKLDSLKFSHYNNINIIMAHAGFISSGGGTFSPLLKKNTQLPPPLPLPKRKEKETERKGEKELEGGGDVYFFGATLRLAK